MPNNPGRPLAPHVQAAIAKGQGVGVQPKLAEAVSGRPIAAHVQQAIQSSMQAKLGRPTGTAAAHVKAAIGGGARGQQAAADLRAVVTAAVQQKVTGRELAARVREATAATVQAEKKEGLRRRKPAPKPAPVQIQAGRREAFFMHSQATHAVVKIDGVIYGLAGDLGGVDIGVDSDHKPSEYTWAGPPVSITRSEANDFLRMMRQVARKMTYDLFRKNCYTPVSAALRELRDRYQGQDKYDSLQRMLGALGRDNLGLGTKEAKKWVKKIQ